MIALVRAAAATAALVLSAPAVAGPPAAQAPVPAASAPAFDPPQTVLPCAGPTALAATADGTVWGVGSCTRDAGDEPLQLLRRSPSGSLSRTVLPLRGYPLAVADDGATTFVVYSTGQLPASNGLSIAKVPHGGRASAATVLSSFSEIGYGATLAARDGKWWAVWTQGSSAKHGEYSSQLLQRGTLTTSGTKALDTGPYASEPHLALRGDAAVLAYEQATGDDGDATADPAVRLAALDRAGRLMPVAIPPGDRTDLALGDVVVSGGRTLVSYEPRTSSGGPGRFTVAQDAGDLVFTERTVATRSAPGRVQLAASGGSVFAAYEACFTYSGGDTCRAYVAQAGSAGGFGTAEVSAPAGRRDPHVVARVGDITAVRGRPTVTTSYGSTTVAQTGR